MKALVYTANEEMIYREEPEPKVEDGDALIEIEVVGICGSDMHAYLGHDPRRVPPLILGHEAVGKVISGLNPGQTVVLNPLISCCTCLDCLSGRQNLCSKRDLIGMFKAGAFAERIAIPERNLIPMPEGMDPLKAVLTEPASTALHAIHLAEKSLSRPISEMRTLVIGGGSIGLLTALILLDKGVWDLDLHETNALRREQLTKDVQAQIIDPISNPPTDNSYDLIFDAVGNFHTRTTAVRCAKPGSSIVHIGLMDNEGGLDVRKLTLQEITFIGCYTYTPIDLQITLNKLHCGALGKLDWVKTLPLSEGGKAFQELLAGECAAPKVVLKIN